MPKLVVTFFGRDEKNHRQYLFPDEGYWIYDQWGNIKGWDKGITPQSVYKMMTWLEEQPILKMMKSYGIGYAFTDICPSSIIIDVRGDDPEALEEAMFSLKIFGGRDIRFRDPDDAIPRRRFRPTTKARDRYAR